MKNRSMKDGKRFIAGLQAAWREEMNSALAYRSAAGQETDARRRAIFLRLAEQEEKHAALWEQRLSELGAAPGPFRQTRAEANRLQSMLKGGTANVAQVMEAGERDAETVYTNLASRAPTQRDREVLQEALKDERAHDLILTEMGGRPEPPSGRLERMLGRERWHVRSGGWIGQAIYGINDGLGAAFGVVSGVAGATRVNGSFVLLSGFATMIASALSMGSGAYLATKSEREIYEAEMAKERREIEEHPEEELEELSLFYQLKGFTAEEAGAMVARLADKPEEMLKILAHEELGLSERSFPNEWKSAASAAVSTALGAAIPVLPYLFASGLSALIASFVISTAAHFAVGAAKVVVTGRSWLRSGLEMMLIGLGEAAITYGIGLLVAPLLGRGL
jgi:VIT1/CCC1 family predicted Fe2+/Mn2+ transporter/rubrerythrin